MDSAEKSKYKSIFPKFIYMKIKLMLQDDVSIDFDIVSLKELILKSLKERFGEMGKSLPVDVLGYNETTREGIIRCSDIVFNRLSCSLLFCCEFRSLTFYAKILKVSYSSLALTSNSRTYRHSSSRNLLMSDNRKRKHE